MQGKRIGIDATTLEANAAMRSIVRRDTGASYHEFLTGLANASGMETPTREDVTRLDRKRKKCTSNKEWKSPIDQDARVAKMKDGSTHLAHKAEHAVDMDSGAAVAVTLQAADLGDTTTMQATLAEAGMAVAELVGREAELHPGAEPQIHVDGIEELVVDKGYHSGAAIQWVGESEVRSYIPERKQTGKRNWEGKQAERQAVEANRGRVTGDYGKQLLRRRSEFVECSFAHCYEKGGMRRCTLRGRDNILKRLLVHVGAFNLGLVLRKMLGAGTPRELKNRAASLILRLPVPPSLQGRGETRQRPDPRLFRQLPLRPIEISAGPDFGYLHHGLPRQLPHYFKLNFPASISSRKIFIENKKESLTLNRHTLSNCYL